MNNTEITIEKAWEIIDASHDPDFYTENEDNVTDLCIKIDPNFNIYSKEHDKMMDDLIDFAELVAEESRGYSQ
tara:strand:+ start:452 stop:670 length:219 start_codon:yes stop_codon:yes gene_type:complete